MQKSCIIVATFTIAPDLFVIFRPISFKIGWEVDLRMGNRLKVTGVKSFNWSFSENMFYGEV